jgi:hypothetical protein
MPIFITVLKFQLAVVGLQTGNGAIYSITLIGLFLQKPPADKPVGGLPAGESPEVPREQGTKKDKHIPVWRRCV